MKKSKIINSILSTIIVILLITFGVVQFQQSAASTLTTETVSVKPVNAKILATGMVESENEADLHFVTGGKLVSLPFKEGDKVTQGQTIAAVDSFPLQQQLKQAYLAYNTQQLKNDQVQEYNNAGVLEGQQRVSLDTTNKQAYNAETEADVVKNGVDRLLTESANATSADQINIDLANYAITNSALTAPFDGIITHEDVTSSGVNVSPTATFSVADPNALIFKVYVSETDIHYVKEGANAQITLNGDTQKYDGTVAKVYPQKTTLASGEQVYRVDIKADGLLNNATLKQGGSVLIDNSLNSDVMLVPSWTVLNNSTVWVVSNSKVVKKQVTIGDTVGTNVEIKSGLEKDDKVVTNPKTIIQNKYFLL